jgi:hypothetical protein
MTNLDKLADKLFNRPNPVSDIKFFPMDGDADIETVSLAILNAIESVQKGEGRDIDLSF